MQIEVGEYVILIFFKPNPIEYHWVNNLLNCVRCYLNRLREYAGIWCRLAQLFCTFVPYASHSKQRQCSQSRSEFILKRTQLKPTSNIKGFLAHIPYPLSFMCTHTVREYQQPLKIITVFVRKRSKMLWSTLKKQVRFLYKCPWQEILNGTYCICVFVYIFVTWFICCMHMCVGGCIMYLCVFVQLSRWVSACIKMCYCLSVWVFFYTQTFIFAFAGLVLIVHLLNLTFKHCPNPKQA